MRTNSLQNYSNNYYVTWGNNKANPLFSLKLGLHQKQVTCSNGSTLLRLSQTSLKSNNSKVKRSAN